MPDRDCNRILGSNTTSKFRKCENGDKHGIDKETKNIGESLKLIKKMECYANRPVFINIKNHKPNFRNNTKCSIINPAKNESILLLLTLYLFSVKLKIYNKIIKKDK